MSFVDAMCMLYSIVDRFEVCRYNTDSVKVVFSVLCGCDVHAVQYSTYI